MQFELVVAIDMHIISDQRHDTVSPLLDILIAEQQCLRDSFAAGMLGEAITAVFDARNLPNGDLPFCHTVLDPQLTELYMSHFAQSSAVRYSFGCTRVSVQ